MKIVDAGVIGLLLSDRNIRDFCTIFRSVDQQQGFLVEKPAVRGEDTLPPLMNTLIAPLKSSV